MTLCDKNFVHKRNCKSCNSCSTSGYLYPGYASDHALGTCPASSQFAVMKHSNFNSSSCMCINVQWGIIHFQTTQKKHVKFTRVSEITCEYMCFVASC